MARGYLHAPAIAYKDELGAQLKAIFLNLRRQADATYQVGIARIGAHWVEPQGGNFHIGHIGVTCPIRLFEPVEGLICSTEADAQSGDDEVAWVIGLPLLPFQALLPKSPDTRRGKGVPQQFDPLRTVACQCLHLQLFGHRLRMTALTWVVAAIRGWRAREHPHGRDILILVSAALIPIGWVLLLPNHTYIHAPFMVRMLVVPISLAPLALCWPTARSAL